LQTSVAGLADSKRIKTGLDYREQLPLLRAVFGQVLALLTGLRQGDLLPLEKRHLTDEGIDIVTANTHKRLIIEWSPELRGIIDRAFDISSRVRQFVICNRQGTRLSSLCRIDTESRLSRRDSAPGAARSRDGIRGSASGLPKMRLR
jgi:hypothetical protein